VIIGRPKELINVKVDVEYSHGSVQIRSVTRGGAATRPTSRIAYYIEQAKKL